MTWTPLPSPANNRVQHWSAEGVPDPVLPSGGLTLGTSAGPLVVSDGSSHAIVVGLKSGEIFADWVPPGTGAAGWPADGRGVFYQAHADLTPKGAGWGAGDLIVAFNGVAASRVDTSGYLGVPQPGPLEVSDVRPDQGGFVNAIWFGSYLDPYGVIDHYTLERGVVNTGGGPWTVMATLPAHTMAGGLYGMVIATGADSTPAGIPRFPFRVVGHDVAGTLALVSTVATGYSTDDIAPGVPTGFTGYHNTLDTFLSWNPSSAPDLCCYRLYRGNTADFPLYPTHLVTETTATSFHDIGVLGDYYQLVAVDIHGNPSDPAALAPSQIVSTGVGDEPTVTVTSLAEPSPSPARDHATVRFGVPRGVDARVEVFTVDGGRARTLAAGPGDGRWRSIDWDLRDERGTLLSSGLYFLRMTAPGVAITRRLVIVR